ncbi:MAG: hypothetical protein IT336_02720 [Thermomicrobiales bacterium]|nr:hypothetical protein [Thermomicrobiales bacterium]
MRTSIGRPYSKKRMRAGRRLAKFGAVSLVVMMLAMALQPLTSSGVSAADNSRIINSSVLETTVVDDIVVDPEETPVPDPDLDEDIVAEVFDDELIDDLVVDPVTPASIQVVKYGCDEDFGGDYYELAQNCELMSAEFDVYYTGGEQHFNDSFIAENVVPGDVTVAETVPVGYGEPYVFCSSFYADGGESGFAQVPTAQGAFIDVIDQGEYLYCDWYNVPVNHDGTVTIKKWECPENLAFVVEPTWEDYLAACDAWMNDVNFSLDYEDDAETDLSGTTGDDGDGTLVFDGVKPGNIVISEEIPAGYGDPVVFCGFGAIYDEDGDGVAIAVDGFAAGGLLEGGVLEHEMLPTEGLYCDWFNFPYDNDDDVVIYKWLCPEDFDAYNASLEELLYTCTQAMHSIDFSLYGDGENFIGEGSTDGDGYIGFKGLGAGNYALNESLPHGYGTPIIYCDRPDYDFEQWTVDGEATIQFDLYDGGWIACHWFNIPDDDDIVIIKWECPEGYDAYDATYEELLENCTQYVPGIDFSLYGEGENFYGTETTDEFGSVQFDGLESGYYALNESVPSGYGTPIVFCDRPDYGYENYPVYGYGSIEFEYNDEGWFICHWFNVPENDGSITIFKFTCAPGYDLEAVGADPKADCWTKTDDVRFDLYGDGYDDWGKTGDFATGAVTFGGLEPGDYTAVEEVPAGTIKTYVICQWEDELGPYKYETYYPYNTGDSWVGNAIDLDLHENSDIICWWYNVPEDHDGGDLIVIKYWCDGAIYDEAHCELYGGGADFSVEAANGWGGPIYFTTGWDGTAQLYLESGAYTLTEIDRIWCKAKSDQVDQDGNVVVYDDQTSYVTVFNCGPGQKKDPPAKKFPNTGVAEMVSESGSNNGGTMGLLFSVGMVAAIVGLRTARPATARIAIRQERGE